MTSYSHSNSDRDRGATTSTSTYLPTSKARGPVAAAAQVDPVLNDSIGIDVLRHQQSNQEVTAPIPIPWKKSSAKEDLVKELLNPTSAIRNMSIDEIYQSNAKYKCYKYDNFYNNVSQ